MRRANRRDRTAKTETEQRVDRIMDMMTTGTWVPGRSHRALAAEWSLTITTVERLAAEASRILRRVSRGDEDEIRTRMCAGIEAIRVRAELKTKARTRRVTDARGRVRYEEITVPDPDYQTALKAYELQAKLLGLLRPDVDVTIPIMAGGSTIVSGVVILPPEDPPPSVETTGTEVAEPKRLNGGSNGNGRG
jgi:hypothetical protein